MSITSVDVKRWAREPLPFSIAILVSCLFPIQSKWLQWRIGNFLLIELRRCLLLERVMHFLEEVNSLFWTPFCLSCLSTLCLSITFRNGWSMVLIVFSVLSFGKAPMIYMEDFTWLIGNLFALIKIKEVWEFVIFEPSILLFYPSDSGDFFMIHILRGWLLSFIIIIEEESLMIYTILSLSMSPFFGEEFPRLPWLSPPASKLKWGMVAW